MAIRRQASSPGATRTAPQCSGTVRTWGRVPIHRAIVQRAGGSATPPGDVHVPSRNDQIPSSKSSRNSQTSNNQIANFAVRRGTCDRNAKLPNPKQIPKRQKIKFAKDRAIVAPPRETPKSQTEQPRIKTLKPIRFAAWKALTTSTSPGVKSDCLIFWYFDNLDFVWDLGFDPWIFRRPAAAMLVCNLATHNRQA